MKHSLQLKLSQHLTLTPQLQQSIRLLQLSTVELNQELERYLAENPLLERADLGPPDESGAPPPNGTAPEGETLRQEETREDTRREESRDEPPNFADEHGFGDEHSPTGGSRRDDDDREDFTQFAAHEPTLQEHLLGQLSLTGLTQRDKRIAEMIIGHLDE
ncbi:MAG TPA: RNA polymerase factor sigma-54, partial [Usitatibacter sp.]